MERYDIIRSKQTQNTIFAKGYTDMNIDLRDRPIIDKLIKA